MTYEEVINKLKRGEKMTYEEVLNRLKICVDECDDCLTCKAMEDSIEIAIEVIETKIPKKPIIRETEDHFGYVKYILCPNCKEVEFGFTQPCFCHRCGQAIDWKDNE